MKKSWFDIVIEKQMSLQDALAFMGLKNDVSKKDVETRYKELSKKYHPDLGGNPEDMKTLNMARDILSKAKFSTNMRMNDIEEEFKMRRNAVQNFARDYLDSINIKKYIDYLNNIFSENFTYKKDLSISFYLLAMQIEFSNADRSKVFDLHISLNNEDIEKALFGEKRVISAKDVSFKIYMYSNIYLDGKKQILTKERYTTSDKSDWNENPETLLPKARLEKLATGTVRKGKVSKKDFVAMITMKHGGESNEGKWFHIFNNNRDYRLDIHRMVLSLGVKISDRYISYGFDSIYKRIDGRLNKFISSGDLNKYGVENKRLTSFEENEENLKMWDNLIGKFKKVENDNDVDKWLKLLASEIKKLPLMK